MAENYFFDKWDPEGPDYNRTTYNWDENTQTITPNPNGGFIHYVLHPDIAKEHPLYNDLYWNRRNGWIIYRDANNKYQVYRSGKTAFHHLNDSELDEIQSTLEAQAAATQQQKELQEKAAKEAATPSAGRVDSITIEPRTTTDSSKKTTDQTQASNVASANTQLQNLIAQEEANETVDKPKEETVYYNYGPEEIDLKYYLHNLSTNLQAYMNSQNWNSAQRAAFQKAYEKYKTGLTEQLSNKSSRFTTDDAGILIDSIGALDGKNDHIFIDENGNTYNSLDEISSKKLRKTAIEFSPNDEVANYFNTIGQAVVAAGKTKKGGTSDASKAFDFNKNGFQNYWVSKVNPAGGKTDINPYLELDPVGADGKRQKTNRLAYLTHELQTYAKYIDNGDFNFEGTPFKSKKEYLTKIQNAIANLSNGWDSSDPASLQAVGITSDFYDYFLSDKANPVATPEEEAAAKTEDEEKRLAIAKDSFVKKAKVKYDEYITKGNRYTRNHTKLYATDYRYQLPTSSEGPEADAYRTNISDFFKSLNYTLPGTPGSATWSNAVSSYYDALWKKTREALYKGDASIIVNNKVVTLDTVLPVLMPFALASYFKEDSTGTQVDMNDYDGETGTVLCAKDGHLYFDWAFDHKESNTWQKLAAKFQEAFDKVNSTATNPYGLTYTFQKGGEIKILKEGGIPADATPEEIQAYIEAETAADKEGNAESPAESSNTGDILDENGKLIIPEGMTAGQALASKLFGKGQAEAKSMHMSYAQYHAKQRSPNGVQSIMNPESGVWKAEDYARMGAILADITSLVLDPVSGAAVNVGSTATNFVADWLDDSVTAVEMWKNLGMNLGMDALSIIPIVGDAAGTGGKLLKSLKVIAPKLMYGLTAYGMLGTLKNAPNIMQSLSKVTSDEKLTVGDYQNIAQAITAVAGINSGVKSAVAKRLAKRNAKVDDAIGLGIRKKGTEDPAQDVIFRGKHAAELKKLVAAGKVDDVNAYLHKLEGFSNYEVNTNLASVPVSVGLPVGRTAGADGKKHWGVKSPFNVARKIDAFEIYDRSKLRSGYASKTLLNTHRQDAVEAGRNFKETDLFTTKEVDELQKQQIEAKLADAVAATKKRKKLIADVEARISGTKDADGKLVSDGIKQTIAKTEADLRQTQANVAAKQADLNALDPKYLGRKLSYKDSEGRSHSLSRSKKHTLDAQITKAEAALNKAKTDTQTAKDRIANDIVLQRGASPEAEFAKIKARRQELLNKQASGKKLSKKEDGELATLTQDETRISKLFADRDAAIKIEKNAEAKYNALSDWKQRRKEYITTQMNLRSLKGAEAVYQTKLATYNVNLANLRNRLDRLNDKNNRTKQTRQLYDLINSGNPFQVTYGDGLKREVSNKDFKDIVDAAGLLKKGGNIQKFQTGGHPTYDGIVLGANPGSWYSDIFSRYKQDILNRLADPNSDFAQTINDMQRAHYGIYTTAGGSNENWRNQTKYSKDTADYQTKYRGLGYNELGIQPNYKTRYLNHQNSERLTKDSPGGDWQSDGYFSSITDDRRILGRVGDWTDDQINAFQDELKQRGYKMYLDNDTKYYMIGKLGAPVTPSTKDLNIVKYEGRAGGTGDKEKEKPQNEILSSLAKKVSDFAPNPFEYLRYRLLNNDHKRSTEYAMRAEKPFLQTPLVDNVYIQTDLRAENEGNQQKAELMSAASRPMTSDAVRQMALIKDAYAQGQKYADAGMKASDQMLRTTMAADLAQRKENHKQEHLVGESNRLAAKQSQENRDKIWEQYLAQKSLDRDNFLQKWEYDVEKKKAEKKAIEKQATIAQMQNAIKYQPNNYGAGLTVAELGAYNKVLSGISTADLSDSEVRYFNAAQQKVADTITNAYYQYMGAPTTIYTAGSIYQPKTVFTPTLSAKDGAKLETAKLRAKIKNADRFQKSIEKKIDNLNKKLDRISKSMYGKPKLEMVK